MSDSDSSIPSTRSATRLWFLKLSVPITPHCSAVDSSMRVNLVAVISRVSYRSGEPGQHVAGADGPIVEPRTLRHGAAQGEGGDGVDRRQQLAQLAWGREVLLLGGDANFLDPFAGREAGDDLVDQLFGGRRTRGDADRALEVSRQLVRPVDAQD